MFKINGAEKSGSGTILRYAVCISSLLGKNLILYNIREKREKQGLRNQHLQALEACTKITKGTLDNAYVGSNEIFYKPGKKIHGGNYIFDIKTAGSATMLCQTIIPLLLFANKPSSIQIIGGLFQDFAPSAYHFEYVILPLLKKMNLNISFEIIKPGYVPLGGGIIKLQINPIDNNIKSINLEKQGNIKKIKCISLSSHLEKQMVSERMAKSFENEIEKYNLDKSVSKKISTKPQIELKNDTTANQKGACLTCWIETDEKCLIGMDMAGKIKRTAEFIGKRVAKELTEDFKKNATVDRFTADQLILYCALSKGSSSYYIPKMTEHIKTNLWLTQKMLQSNHNLEKNLLTIHGINFQK